MIVKILSAGGKNFSGIHYNEKKNSKGMSELLFAKNFDALDYAKDELTKSDYINYLTKVGGLNTKVKNKQFHAVISTKGKEHSPEELKLIAIKYLEAMGYGNNPYLIYFHSDTPNNHVHMVTTRVDLKGKKIDDSFEKIRSQKVLHTILMQDPKEEAKYHFQHALTYNFSTLAQFKLLLENQGFKLSENTHHLTLIKFGNQHGSFDKTEITNKVGNYIEPNKRVLQLKAIFHKYNKQLDANQFQEHLKDKFGIDIVFHQKADKNTAYGYTIIDHVNKEVFKGSRIMPLKELLTQQGLDASHNAFEPNKKNDVELSPNQPNNKMGDLLNMLEVGNDGNKVQPKKKRKQRKR